MSIALGTPTLGRHFARPLARRAGLLTCLLGIAGCSVLAMAIAPPPAIGIPIPRAWAEAAIIGSGGIRGAAGEIVTPADLDGMTPVELEAAIASGAFRTGWALYCRSTTCPGRT